MIAQPTLSTPTQKSHAHQQAQQSQQQAQGAGNDFQSLLSTTDSSLTDLAQNTGASAAAQQPANSNKKQSNSDPNTTPYVQAPVQPAQTPMLPSKGASSDANATPSNAVMPPTDPAAAASDQTDASDSGNNGNSSAFGADALNARIASGAPIYASQPASSMATVPAHLLDAANAHPLPGENVGKPGDAPASGKTPTDPNAVMAPSAAAAPTAPLLPLHQAVNAPSGNNDKSDDDSTSSQTSDTATTNDPNASASLLSQPATPQTAPVQADAAIHTAAPYVPVGEQVAINLKQALNADNNEIRIQLKPAALGTIDVKLNVGLDGHVNAVISADRSDTLNMLKQDSGQLQQALKDAGLNADSSSLSFNLRGDDQSSFAQNWSQGGGSNGGSGGNGSSYASAGADSLTGNNAAAPAQRAHAGALNIEV